MNHLPRNSFHTTPNALTVGALLCLSVFPSARLHAQTSAMNLNEVVVQSGRLEQKQFDAPASVYTIDANTLRNSGPQVNLSDVLKIGRASCRERVSSPV